MAPRPSVAIRLATEGKAAVKNDFAEIAQAGGASAERLRAKWERETGQIERLTERAAATARRLAAVEQSPVQSRIAGAVGTGFRNPQGSAQASASVFARELQQAELQARQLLAAVDPLFAAQQRYNASIETLGRFRAMGVVTEQQYLQLLRSEAGLLDAATAAKVRNAQASGLMRAGTQQLAFQIQDVAVQAGAGTNAFIILAQQLPQAAAAVNMMGEAAVANNARMGLLATTATRFAAFMASPWGAAITGAGLVLAAFLPRMLATEEQTEQTTGAINRQSASWGTLTRAIRDNIEALRERMRTEEERNAQTVQTAQDTLQRLERDRSANVAQQASTIAAIQLAEQRLRVAAGDPRATGTLQNDLSASQERLATLRRQLGEINEAARQAGIELRLAQTAVSDRRVENMFDRERESVDRLNAALAQLREQRLRERDPMSPAEYERRARALRAEHEARLAALRAEREAANDNSGAGWGRLMMPYSGRVTSGFGPRQRPTAGASTNHRGIDIAAPSGSQVVAPGSGVIIRTGYHPGYGNFVWIDHGGGTVSELNHLTRATAQVGDRVSRGQVVALSGNTGVSTGPHVHWNVRTGAGADGRGGRYVDPRARVYSGGAANALIGDAREAERAAEERAREMLELRRRLDPRGAAETDLATTIGRIRALMGDTPEAERMISTARGQSAADRLLGPGGLDSLRELERVEEGLSERRAETLDQFRQMGAEGQDRMTLLRTEFELLGMNDRQRESVLRRLEQELELNRRFGPEYAEQVRQVIERAAAEDKLRDQIEQTRSAMRELQDTGSGVLDEVFNVSNWDDWGAAGQRVLNMLMQEFVTLAALNPLKNMLFGQNNPTLSSIFGLFGGGGGVKKFAVGTAYASGGLALLGENGPELAHLPRGSRVSTAAETRRLFAANDRGPSVSLTFHNDYRGADPAAVARIEANQRRMEAELPGRVVAAVEEARERNVMRF